MLLVLVSYLMRTDRRQGTTAIDVAGNATVIQLYQCRTGDGAGRTVNLVLVTVIFVNVRSDTRAGTEDVSASTIDITCQSSNTSLEYLYFGTVTYVTVLSTTIDRTIDSWRVG